MNRRLKRCKIVVELSLVRAACGYCRLQFSYYWESAQYKSIKDCQHKNSLYSVRSKAMYWDATMKRFWAEREYCIVNNNKTNSTNLKRFLKITICYICENFSKMPAVPIIRNTRKICKFWRKYKNILIIRTKKNGLSCIYLF